MTHHYNNALKRTYRLKVLTSYRLRKFAFTLSEGARHVVLPDNQRRYAFTLAEVLITLGIIGIVAALTIPSIVADYRNKQTATQLKYAYSVVGQALTAAQVQNGDVSGWDFGYNYGADTSTVNYRETVINFVEKYLKPNLKIADDIGYQYTSSAIGYDGLYKPVSKEKVERKGYWFTLGNGTLLCASISSICTNEDDDGTCTQRAYQNIIITVDTNGFKGPNTYGKDVFLMTLELTSNKFSMHNYGSAQPRTKYVNWCADDSECQVCGYLIMRDGWEIKEDYPWKY